MKVGKVFCFANGRGEQNIYKKEEQKKQMVEGKKYV
jgi:hypothetical protein